MALNARKAKDIRDGVQLGQALLVIRQMDTRWAYLFFLDQLGECKKRPLFGKALYRTFRRNKH